MSMISKIATMDQVFSHTTLNPSLEVRRTHSDVPIMAKDVADSHHWQCFSTTCGLKQCRHSSGLINSTEIMAKITGFSAGRLMMDAREVTTCELLS